MGSADGIPEDAGFWWKLIHLNPALWRALIVAVAGILAYLGIGFAVGFQDSVFGLIVAVIAIVQGVWTKGAVTANKKVVVYKPDPVESPDVLAAGPAVSYDRNAVVNAASDKSGVFDPAS
jgi:hypothetical protein